MSKRRKIGEKVVKKEFAGFVQEPMVLKIPTLQEFNKFGFDYKSEKEDHETCMLCSDPDCVEYANLLVVTNNEVTDEWVYHVSECQMEDFKEIK